jgi:hypothetical protein
MRRANIRRATSCTLAAGRYSARQFHEARRAISRKLYGGRACALWVLGINRTKNRVKLSCFLHSGWYPVGVILRCRAVLPVFNELASMGVILRCRKFA